MPLPWHGLLVSCAWLKSKQLRRLSQLQQAFRPCMCNKVILMIMRCLYMSAFGAQFERSIAESGEPVQAALALPAAL
jgi:hypothetical protein